MWHLLIQALDALGFVQAGRADAAPFNQFWVGKQVVIAMNTRIAGKMPDSQIALIDQNLDKQIAVFQRRQKPTHLPHPAS